MFRSELAGAVSGQPECVMNSCVRRPQQACCKIECNLYSTYIHAARTSGHSLGHHLSSTAVKLRLRNSVSEREEATEQREQR